MEKNKTYLLVSEKVWHDRLFENLQSQISGNWARIKNKVDFTFDNVLRYNPEWVFLPHWSHLIPSNVFERFRCVVFHMTDLPYGRGGSPLQNLILSGHKETKLSAIAVTKEIDAGDIYLQRPLSLDGSAREIFDRAAVIIGEMIEWIIVNEPKPRPQTGDVTIFRRRRPEDSDLKDIPSLEEVYNYIRMLDCEGYPKAFLETANLKFEFSSGIRLDDSIEAHVRITKK